MRREIRRRRRFVLAQSTPSRKPRGNSPRGTVVRAVCPPPSGKENKRGGATLNLRGGRARTLGFSMRGKAEFFFILCPFNSTPLLPPKRDSTTLNNDSSLYLSRLASVLRAFYETKNEFKRRRVEGLGKIQVICSMSTMNIISIHPRANYLHFVKIFEKKNQKANRNKLQKISYPANNIRFVTRINAFNDIGYERTMHWLLQGVSSPSNPHNKP